MKIDPATLNKIYIVPPVGTAVGFKEFISNSAKSIYDIARLIFFAAKEIVYDKKNLKDKKIKSHEDFIDAKLDLTIHAHSIATALLLIPPVIGSVIRYAYHDHKQKQLNKIFGELQKAKATNNPEEIAKCTEKAAKLGDAQAQADIGRFYIGGNGVKLDYHKGLFWYKKAIAQNHTLALRRMAWLYDNGVGVQKNSKKALQYTKRAAELNDQQAQYEYALAFEKANDYKNAVKWHKKAAKPGHLDAEFQLGYIYQEGLGEIERNPYKARKYYEPLAASGNAAALNNLANLYNDGRGVRQDYKKALDLYLKSAKKGNPLAMFHAGIIYYKGHQNSRNNEMEAAEWIEKSAKAGHLPAIIKMGHFSRKGIGVEPDNIKAMEWYKKAAQAGSEKGDYWVGRSHLMNYSSPKELDLAIASLEKAAQKRHFFKAYFYLAEAYRKQGSEQINNAISWYEKAAEGNYLPAQIALGNLYEQGQEIKQDHKEAFKWYEKASKRLESPARQMKDQYFAAVNISMARILRKGEGIKHDLGKAAKMLFNTLEYGENCDEAVRELADMYRNGEGLVKDEEKANQLLQLRSRYELREFVAENK